MSGWQDWNIARFAFENDCIVVTNDRRHFLREQLQQEIHGGLVIIAPNADREGQAALFTRVLDCLETPEDPPINPLIEILGDMTIHVRGRPADDHDLAHVGAPAWDRR